ncbi:MAG: topoisomerase C-terminal repeat-containing protein [Clostridia bacterium]|nr:topoisomerase C-terminal repeat-containing protein [Clostridia bacterium]
MIVIYAEKASLAKAIAVALHAGNRIAHPKEPTIGHYEFTFNGEKAVLCHGVGHLCGLADRTAYGEQYRNWDLSIFPCIPDSYQVAVKDKTKTCFEYVKGFFEKADLIINATDPDREGELIFAYIYEAMHCTKKWKRVWIEDLTPQKIQYAFAHLKDSSEVISIQQAGRARSISDWLCGINLTIAATGKYCANPKDMFRIGRVQTPVLAMVVEREKKIKGHIKTPFWRLLAEFQNDNGSFTAEYEKGIFDNEQQAKSLLSKCVDNGTVTAKTVKKRTVGQPVLFNATQLQATAGKKLGWDLDKTVKVMQDLYEHKFMSYPRTSSEHLTVAMQSEVTTTLRKLFLLPEYSQYALPENEWQAYSKRHFDDSKVDSHPAIIPTMNVPKSLSEIPSEDERHLYDLIVKSLIRIVYPKAEIEDTTVLLDVNGNTFKATGSVITSNGWYAVDALPDKRATLPPVSEGESYQGKYELKQGFTEPPKPYTEPDLITAMETAGKHLEDEQARALMKAENKGLGTAATRATIINSLFARDYLTKKGKSIVPTEKGIFLIDNLPVLDLKSAELTGQWEKRLHEISVGNDEYSNFVTAMEQTVKNWYADIASSSAEIYATKDQQLFCPFCGARVIKGKFGYFCSAKKDKECPFSVSQEICGKKITDSQAIRLIEKGKTTLIKGFKKKGSDKAFDAYLIIDKNQRKIKFEFPKKKS